MGKNGLQGVNGHLRGVPYITKKEKKRKLQKT